MKMYTTISFLFVVIVSVSAIDFNVTVDGNTCVLFNTADNSHIDISNGNETKSYNFGSATVDQGSSACNTQIYLNFGDSVVGEFLFMPGSANNTVVNILVQFNPSQVFPGDPTTAGQIADDDSNRMMTPFEKSYQCAAEETITFKKTENNYTVEMVVSEVRLQPRDVNNGEFSEASICSEDVVTTQPTTKQATTEPPTTEHSNMTTPSSNATTEPTTQHSNGTTEPTTAPGNATTASPTTASTTIPTTTPTPVAPVNKFELQSGNDTCIVFEAGISFDITYDIADQKTASVKINVPNNTRVDTGSSSCNHTTTSQSLALDFLNNWKLSMVFGLESSVTILAKAADDKYSLQTVTLTYTLDPAIFPGTVNPGQTRTVATQMPSGTLEAAGSYKCDKDTTLTLNDTTTNHPISMDTKNLKYQAFGTGNFTDFDSNITECPSDTETNSIVPIAVGAALAGLVIIVLIAYLIGRKRSRGGYEQV